MTPFGDTRAPDAERVRMPRDSRTIARHTVRSPLFEVRVLIVDDHDDTRRMFVEYLSWHGATALEASCVAEAVDVLEHDVVDVVVTDVAMPREDGYALLARMDARASWASIPRIVVSGHSSVLEASERAPRATYLKKPIDLERLLEAIVASQVRAPR